MATPAWHVSGQYYENCSCDFVCPCVAGQLAVKPTKGWCTIVMAFAAWTGSSFDSTPYNSQSDTPDEKTNK